jgi:hypothetical protein
MKIKITLILLFAFISSSFSQNNKDLFFARKWKSYDTDGIFFSYLKLEKNGKGIKAIGTTLEAKDQLKIYDDSYLEINAWYTHKDTLFLFFENHDLPEEFIVKKNSNIQFKALGEHYTYLYGKKKKSIVYEDYQILENYNSPNNKCFEDGLPIKIKYLNSKFSKVINKGSENLISKITNCFDLKYRFSFPDQPYAIKIPKKLKEIGFGASSTSFNYTFRSTKNITETQIKIFYYFGDDFNEYVDLHPLEIISIPCNTIYMGDGNSKEFYCGKVFYKNNIAVTYMTKDKAEEIVLKEAIKSLKFINKN